MNRPESFPHDWIAPGEYRYCPCGWKLIPPGAIQCGNCKNKDVCSMLPGRLSFRHLKWSERPKVLYWWLRSWVRFSWGFCTSTKFRQRFRAGQRKAVERAECEATHRRLEAERNALAEKRKTEGVKPLFWMLQ